MAITLALAAGCGKSDEEAPAEVADTTAALDTASTVIDTNVVEFAPVALPADFPADFPIAASSTVVSATSVPDAGGAYNEVSIVSEGESSQSYQWYRQALTDAGWQISSEGQTDETRTLHATQGESYVDLTVMPHPDRDAGWVRVNASIWKAGT
ncbi:MAG: hypothetical protein ACREK2_03890 [Gemmatimonadota bacterium]